MPNLKLTLAVILSCTLPALLSGCGSVPQMPDLPFIKSSKEAETLPPTQPADTSKQPEPEKPQAGIGSFMVSKWEMLPEWSTTAMQPVHQAFLQSCNKLQHKADWLQVCHRAQQLELPDDKALRRFFESHFTPYKVFNSDGSSQGLVTGYYEPRLQGSRVKTSRYRYPLYGVPNDMYDIELGSLYPQLKNMRLRGRIEGNRIVPYYPREALAQGQGSLDGRELFWVDDRIELFFLQIQGSGRIELPDGSLVKVGYANQNGHPYVSIGRKLVEMGELKLSQASMQGIKRWTEENPDKVEQLLNSNPSFVFFHELPDRLSAPLGALGVPLTEQYSIAVDPRTIPLGAPVFLATTYPNSPDPLNRLVVAQDTGGAIKGAVRADFFWGFGEQAGQMAGRMKQRGQMWVLFPNGSSPKAN